MSDRLSHWKAAILAVVIFLSFLGDIIEFLTWNFRHALEPLLRP